MTHGRSVWKVETRAAACCACVEFSPGNVGTAKIRTEMVDVDIISARSITNSVGQDTYLNCSKSKFTWFP
jgi:hypothetical protein